MKKLIFLVFIFYSFVLLAVGLPHSAYFQVYSLNDTTMVYPDTVSFKSWIIGREDEILTEHSFGCAYYKDKNVASVQVGNFNTPWSLGEKLEIEVYTNLGNERKIITITNEGAQWFVRNYQGKDGIMLAKKEKKIVFTTLLQTKIKPKYVTFNVAVKEGENATLSIYDKSMKLIKTTTLTSKDKNYVFSTEKLPSGLYFYRLKSSSYNQTKKMIIMN